MNWKLFSMLTLMLVVAAPLMAQEPAAARPAGFVLPLAFAMAIASGLCGLGQGKAIAASAEAIARNPGAGNVIRGLLLLGLAFIESLALFTLIIVFRG